MPRGSPAPPARPPANYTYARQWGAAPHITFPTPHPICAVPPAPPIGSRPSRSRRAGVYAARTLRPAPRLLALTLAALLAAALTGCAQLPAPAAKTVTQARQALDAGRFQECENRLNPVISANAKNPATAEALYLRGQSRLQRHQRRQAWDDFDSARVLTKDPTLRALLQVQLGNMAFDSGSYDQAHYFYAPALTALPAADALERAWYQHAVAIQRAGRFAEARQAFGRFVQKYPDTDWQIAIARLAGWQPEYFSVQCGVFASVDSAHKLADTLREAGFEAVATPGNTTGQTLYYVRIGRFRTHAEAQRLLDRVRAQQPDAFIVP